MIKIIPYRNKSILLKNDKAFVLKESVNESEENNDIKFNIKSADSYDSIEEAIDAIDSDYFDKYELPTVVYQVIVNPGEDDEHTEELTDLFLAQELFDGLKVDPADYYKSIKLVKFNYENDSEEILDFVDFSETKKTTDESVISEDVDEEKLSRNYNLLGRLANIKRQIEAIYDDFNDRSDTDILEYNLKLVKTSLDQLLSRLK